MFFNSSKFQYRSVSSSIASNRCNVYYNPDLAIIKHLSDVLALGIYMSSKSSFELHYQQSFKKVHAFNRMDIAYFYYDGLLKYVDFAQIFSPVKIELWIPTAVSSLGRTQKSD